MPDHDKNPNPTLQTLQSFSQRLAGYDDRSATLTLRKQDMTCWSYARLADQVQALRTGLIEAGLEPGERVALLAGNRPEWLAVCLAVIEAGAVIVPLDVQFGSETLKHVLTDSQARFIFTTAQQSNRIKQLELDVEPKLVLLDAGEKEEQSWRQWLSSASVALPEVEPQDPAVLFYTSGTTGPPKGVPLSHGNLIFQIKTLIEAEVVTEHDRVLLPLPLHHVYPFAVGMLTPLALGLPIIWPHALTGPQIVRALQEAEATVVIGVPRLYQALYSGLEGRLDQAGGLAALLFQAGLGLSRWLRQHLGLRIGRLLLGPVHNQFGPKLRLVASGGAKLDTALAWKLAGLGWQVATGYGLTETAPLLAINIPGQARIGSAGRPVSGVEIRLDPTARPGDNSEPASQEPTTRPRIEGEILARGPNVFSGYHNLPDQTARAFTGEGWFRTGDLGYLDDDDYLYVSGRVSTVIVTESGENIQPDEVEAAYNQSPVIREVGVFQEEGRLVAAIVPELSEIRQRGNGEIEQAVRQAVETQSKTVPSYRQISDYVITRTALPRTRLGKIKRHRLVERYHQAKQETEAPGEPVSLSEMSAEDRALLEENRAARQLWEWLTDRYSDRRLTPDTSPQLDLGVDSLEWVNLTLEIRQRVGVELDEAAIGRIDTIRDLLREVIEASEAGPEAGEEHAPLEQPEAELDEQQQRRLEPLGPEMSALARGMFALNRALIKGYFGLRVEGRENLPEEGPFVLTPNHVSYLDALALAAALRMDHLRQIHWAGSRNILFMNPLFRLVSRLAQVVPIDAERAATSSLAFGAAVLKRKKGLVWFPEGRRSATGQLEPFRPGIGMLLERYRVPVLPVFIHGTYQALPPGRFWPKASQLTIHFGPPLNPRDLAQQGHGDQPHERITHALHEQVAQLGSR